MANRRDEERTDWSFMLPMVLGTMMNPLNSTMLATALTTICNSFARDAGSGALLIVPLYMATTIGQPLMGKLADIYNPKMINRLGFILVMLAALIGIVAPDFNWLIVSRVILGLGTSAAYPSAMALITHRYQTKERAIPGNILGIITVSSQVSMVLGPILGGFLTEAFGWRGIFFINIPWVICALYFSKNVPSVGRGKSINISSIVKEVDIIGIVIFAVFLLLLMQQLIQPDVSVMFTGIAALAFISFLMWERKQLSPFIDVRLLWQQPSLLFIFVRTLATNYILYVLLYALPQWVEAIKQMSPSQTGLIMFPMAVMSAVSAMVIARYNNLFRTNTLGIFTMVTACSGLFLLNVAVPIWGVVGMVMLTGMAVGINSIANQSSLSAEVPSNLTGVSFGLYRTFGYLGAIISGTQLKILFHKGVTDRSLHTLAWYAVISCVLLAVLYFSSLKRLRRSRVNA
jgi:MFS family permease